MKKRGIREIDGFRKKLMIPYFEIPNEMIFMNEKIFEEYSVKIYEIYPYFHEHYKEKVKVDKSERKYILFRTDVYFTDYFLAVEVDEQNHEGRDLIFEKKTRGIRRKN